ncbi:hypothetical protein [Helicobacter felis]|uniref:hypothetical protein n=1 Tax=Helicobacter felis TaxID=214 RepID=UPI002D77641B|nr:hypothetical protein [Helicobacter felis]
MLFKTFAINHNDTKKTQVKSIEIQVNMPCFGYLLNFLNANFTSFELLEFQNITENMPRHFIDFSSNGEAQECLQRWSGRSLENKELRVLR